MFYAIHVLMLGWTFGSTQTFAFADLRDSFARNSFGLEHDAVEVRAPAEAESSDHAVLLQTLSHVVETQHRMRVDEPIRKPRIDSAHLHTAHVMRVDRAVQPLKHVRASSPVCTGSSILDLLTFDTRLHLTSLPFIANFSVKRDCSPRQPFSLLAKEVTVSPNSTRTPPLMPLAMMFALCIFAMAWYLARTLLFPGQNTEEHLERMAKLRPERVAWDKSFVHWLTMSWVDPWMAHWGNVKTSNLPYATAPRIDARLLGGFGWEDDESEHVAGVLQSLWSEQAPNNTNLDLAWVILRFITVQKFVLVGLVFGIYQGIFFFGPALAIRSVMGILKDVHMVYRDDPSSFSMTRCYYPTLYVIAIFTGGGLLMLACDAIIFMTLTRVGVQIRGGLHALCFQKAQRVHGTCSEFQSPFAGEQASAKYSFVALINNDISNGMSDIFVPLYNIVFFIPVILVLCTLLVQTIHQSLVFTLVTQVVLIGCVIAAATGQARTLKAGTDVHGQRIALCQEIFQGIRVIKSYAWEAAAARMLNKLRKLELVQLGSYYRSTGMLFLIIFNFPRVLLFASLGGYVWMYGDVDVIQIFTLMQLLRCYNSALREVTSSIPNLARIYPALTRLGAFLRLPESERLNRIESAKWDCGDSEDSELMPAWADSTASGRKIGLAVSLEGSFSWDPELPAVLQDVELQIYEGELVAIVGEVGAGKTAIITALLGELHCWADSHVKIPSLDMAYHAQEPVICEGTIRDNIIFWRDYDEKRYEQVLYDACLLHDLQHLPGSDCCRIGHRGVALSAGQRARVSLARAAYNTKSDLLLLDDPFSSMDTCTTDHILQNLVNGEQMKNKTRVVVMQPDIGRLRQFDRVVVMQRGQIVAQGDPTNIEQLLAFQQLLTDTTGLTDASAGGEAGEGSTGGSIVETPGHDRDDAINFARVAIDAAVTRELRDQEFEGRADWKMFKYFLRLGGNWHAIVWAISFGIMILSAMLADIVLVQWGDAEARNLHRPSTFLFAYAFWTSVGILLYFPVYMCGTSWALNIAGSIFDVVCSNLLGAPVDSFHDKHPLGRILNRLSTDMSAMDFTTFSKATSILGMLYLYFIPILYVQICCPVWFTTLSIPFHFLMYHILRRYWNMMVPMRYLTSVTRSRLSSYVGDVGNMRSTLRAYGVVEKVWLEQTLAVDDSMRAEMANLISRKWLCLRMGVSYILFLTVMVLTSVWLPGVMSISSISLCISYIMGIICEIEFTLEQVSDAQFQVINMNRIHEYTQLPRELPATFPSDAKYSSFFVKVRRAELGSLKVSFLHALAKISFSLNPKEAIKRNLKRISIVRHGSVIFEETEDGKAFQLGAGTSWGDIVSKTSHPELLDGHHWHRLVAVGGRAVNTQSMADILCNGKEAELTLSIQSDWLKQGAGVNVQGLTAGYSKFPDTLHGIDFNIEPMSKAAIVGMTGSGKSTFLHCLLRLLEARSGCILINGIDISTLGLQTLRSALGLVPQDPVLFSGPVRLNLDPFEEHSDERIWDALCVARMGSHLFRSKYPHAAMDEFEAGLTAAQISACLAVKVHPHGENFSFGERHLLCIVRMILRQPALLLLDECSLGNDPQTQQCAQDTLRTAFPRSTMIVIAHRFESILDFDTIAVFDRGRVKKVGRPQEFSKAADLEQWAMADQETDDLEQTAASDSPVEE